MNFELNEYKSELTDNEIISDIKSTATLLNTEYLSISLYRKHGKYSQTAIQGHFGTWTNALKIAGLRSVRTPQELKRIKDEDYFEDLLKISTNLSKDTVTFEEYKMYGSFSAESIFKRYKKWDDFLVAAGLKPTGLARHKILELTLFDEIERIWTSLGRQPTSTDIINSSISKYSLDTYKRRFGGWRKTLEAFVLYINTNFDNEPTDNIALEIKIDDKSGTNKILQNNNDDILLRIRKTSRNINLRLRFKVLNRDNFTCVMCGASPAKSPNVELPFDHVVPWSKGGETVLDNLQTLCANCNLGKSNIT